MKKDIVTVITMFIVVLALIIGAMFFSAYAFSLAWGWIMVPIFGLPVLTMMQSMGLSLIVNRFTHYIYQAVASLKETEEVRSWNEILMKAVGKMYGHTLAFLAAAWVVSHYI